MDYSTLNTPRTRNTDLKFWLMWVIANTAGILLSFVVLYGLIFFAKAISPSINEERLAGGIGLPITATILGVCQWLILRNRIPKSRWWILATIIGIVGGTYLAIGAAQAKSHITGQELYRDFTHGFLMLCVVIGFLLALVQLPILWRYLRSSILWLLASMIGWFILGKIADVSIDGTSDIIATGEIPAIFTGFGLICLRQNPRIEPEHSL